MPSSIAEALKDVAAIFGITSGEMALVISSMFGSVIGVAASYAAWRAANATRASVDEMREARLQSVRPVPVVRIHDNATLAWTHGRPPTIQAGDHLQDVGLPLVLEFQNFGSGPAIDVKVEWVTADGSDISKSEINNAKEFFARGGLALTEHSETSLEIFDPDVPGRWN